MGRDSHHRHHKHKRKHSKHKKRHHHKKHKSREKRSRSIEISIKRKDLEKITENLELPVELSDDVSTSDSEEPETSGRILSKAEVLAGGSVEESERDVDQKKSGENSDGADQPFDNTPLKHARKIVLNIHNKEKEDAQKSYSSSRSRSRSRDRSRRSRSRSRDRSRWSRSGSRDRSRRSGSRSRDRSRRSRSGSRDRSRQSRSRSRDRSRRSRSGSRDRSRRSGSRSRDRSRRSGSRSRDRSRRSRSRSRGWSKRRVYSRRSRSKSPTRSRSRRKRSRRRRGSDSRSPRRPGEHVRPPRKMSTPDAVIPDTTSLSSYTKLCEQISQNRMFSPTIQTAQQCATEMVSSVVPDTYLYRDPFTAANSSGSTTTADLVYHDSSWKTPTQAVLDGAMPSAVMKVENSFPVSDGQQHHVIEDVQGEEEIAQPEKLLAENVNVSELVMKRICLSQSLSMNPEDGDTQSKLEQVEKALSAWSNSKYKLGQFTGQVSVQAIPMADHNKGQQAWVRRDMFKNLKPLEGGFGMKMLMSMGWQPGNPLGKSGQGQTEPISEDLKLDRKCLAANNETVKNTVVSSTLPVSEHEESTSGPPLASSAVVCATGCYAGKHPVSALHELSTRKRWTVDYDLIECSGPSHNRNFKYQVKVPLGTFKPDSCSSNKKLAKAEAAIVCLKALGLA